MRAHRVAGQHIDHRPLLRHDRNLGESLKISNAEGAVVGGVFTWLSHCDASSVVDSASTTHAAGIVIALSTTGEDCAKNFICLSLGLGNIFRNSESHDTFCSACSESFRSPFINRDYSRVFAAPLCAATFDHFR